MKQNSLSLAVILVIAGTIFFTNLGAGTLWDRDEPRNAGCAAEMMARGDWVTPIFNDELRHQKPVLLYWLMMSAYTVFGHTEFAARFWSALLATGTVGLTWLIGVRLFSPRTAMIAAIALSSSLMFVVAARAATPDSVLIFCGTLAISIWVYAVFDRPQVDQDGITRARLKTAKQWFPQSVWTTMAIFSAMALGVLAKGPVGIVVPTAIIGMFLLIQRLSPLRGAESRGPFVDLIHRCLRPFYPVHFLKTCWSMRPHIAMAMLLIIAAPWYIWVGIRTEGDWLEMFFLNEHWGRATTTFESHSGGPWYYPVAILAGFFPWSIFILPMILLIDREFKTEAASNEEERSIQRAPLTFLVCWVLVQVGIFTVAKTKLPSYVTPCYPALAMLTAFYLDRLLANSTAIAKVWKLASPTALLLAGVVTTVGLAYLGSEYAQGKWWIGLIGLIPTLAGLSALFLTHHRMDLQAIQVMGCSAVLFCVGVFGFTSVAVNQSQNTAQILTPIQRSSPDCAIATYGCLESTWVYYANRPIHEIDSAATRGQSLQREKSWHVKPRIRLDDFIAGNPNALIITTDEFLDEVQSQLPNEYRIVSEANYFLKNKKLFLLGPRDDQIRSADNQSNLR